jgi:TetR/AcrR family transcriptional repressor of nem operon
MGLEGIAEMIEEAAECSETSRTAIRAIVTRYLAIRHTEDASVGCPIAALGSELTRADEETRAVAFRGFLKLVAIVAKQYGRSKPGIAESRALFTLAAMIGGATVAQITADPQLSASILQMRRTH